MLPLGKIRRVHLEIERVPGGSAEGVSFQPPDRRWFGDEFVRAGGNVAIDEGAGLELPYMDPVQLKRLGIGIAGRLEPDTRHACCRRAGLLHHR